MKTRSIVLLFSISAFFLLTAEDCANNGDVLKPNVEYYTSNYFLNDSLPVSEAIQIGSDCRLTDATDALVVDEDDIYFYFLSKAFVNDDNTEAVIEVKRSDFKIRKQHINKTIAYIRNAPMKLDDIAEWTNKNDIEDYKETDEVEFEETKLEEVEFPENIEWD